MPAIGGELPDTPGLGGDAFAVLLVDCLETPAAVAPGSGVAAEGLGEGIVGTPAALVFRK